MGEHAVGVWPATRHAESPPPARGEGRVAQQRGAAHREPGGAAGRSGRNDGAVIVLPMGRSRLGSCDGVAGRGLSLAPQRNARPQPPLWIHLPPNTQLHRHDLVTAAARAPGRLGTTSLPLPAHSRRLPSACPGVGTVRATKVAMMVSHWPRLWRDLGGARLMRWSAQRWGSLHAAAADRIHGHPTTAGRMKPPPRTRAPVPRGHPR